MRDSDVVEPLRVDDDLEQPKNLGGRPPKLEPTDEIIKQIHGLSRIQCTMREAAAVLGVHRDTFSRFINTHEKAMAAWEDGAEDGKASLRRLQFKNAEAGNPTMQVWLGKQWLDQKDKAEADYNVSMSVTEVKRTIVDPRNSDT